jgi:hypothetical protein
MHDRFTSTPVVAFASPAACCHVGRTVASTAASSSIRSTPNVIVHRFEAAAGNQAVLVETGETFEPPATQGAGTGVGLRPAPAVADGPPRNGRLLPVARGCPHCGGQRFESPQLQQEVRANRIVLAPGNSSRCERPLLEAARQLFCLHHHSPPWLRHAAFTCGFRV